MKRNQLIYHYCEKPRPDIVWAVTPRDVFLVDVDREELLGEV